MRGTVFYCLALFGATEVHGESHTWTSAKDPSQTFVGELVDFRDDEITVRREDGRMFTFPMEQVIPADQELARRKVASLLRPNLTDALRGRRSELARAANRLNYGGTAESDESVRRAFAYLSSRQDADGSWGTEYKVAMTGLSTLCYLGNGITPDDPEYGETVAEGLSYLVGFHTKDRIFATATDHARCYEHAIAVTALAEAHSLIRASDRTIPNLEAALRAGILTIIEGQSPDGGWTYGYPARGSGDTSVTGWQIYALRALLTTGIEVDGLSPCVQNALGYFDDIQDHRSGMFPYRPGGAGKQSLTGVGITGLRLQGGRKYADEIENGVRAISKDIAGRSWRSADLAMWFDDTDALIGSGGDAWKEWNDRFRDELVANQATNGSWPYGRFTDPSGEKDQIYPTCLCTLMLQSYYRYLPTGYDAVLQQR